MSIPMSPRKITAAALYQLTPDRAAHLSESLLDTLDRCKTLEARRLIMRARKQVAGKRKCP